jgi:PE family
MSFVFATPEYVAGAASDLASIGSTISSANAAALAPTSGVLAAGADEVSATIAALFDAHAQAYQALSAQAALFHQQFVQLMSDGGTQYALTEAANASPLQTVEQSVTSGISAPAQAAASASPTGGSASWVPAAAPGGGSGVFGPGGSGAAGQLVSSVGADPAAAAVGSGGGSFGIGGAGLTGSLVAGQNLGAVPAAGGSGGLVGSGGAIEAAGSAEELGIGETSAAAAPASAVTPLAAVPATAPAAPAAAARPGTPAYSPATAAVAEPSEE